MKHLKFIPFFSLFLFSILSCKEEAPPPLPFEEEKIISVLSDVHLAEAAIQSLGKAIKDSMSQVYYDQIYEIHGIQKQDFEQLMEMLRNRPGDLKRIYGKMMERFEIREKEVNAKKQNSTSEADSTDLIKMHTE